MTKPRTARSRPKEPPQTAGERLKAAVLELYVLDPSERTLLDRIAALLDIVIRLEQRIAAEDVITKGSRGQEVASPLLVVHRSHAKTLAAMLDQLALPRLEQEQGQPSPASRARRAALQRWNREVG